MGGVEVLLRRFGIGGGGEDGLAVLAEEVGLPRGAEAGGVGGGRAVGAAIGPRLAGVARAGVVEGGEERGFLGVAAGLRFTDAGHRRGEVAVAGEGAADERAHLGVAEVGPPGGEVAVRRGGGKVRGVPPGSRQGQCGILSARRDGAPGDQGERGGEGADADGEFHGRNVAAGTFRQGEGAEVSREGSGAAVGRSSSRSEDRRSRGGGKRPPHLVRRPLEF